MSNAAASRTLTALEERLGARLVERTTRRLWLTDAGRDYHRRCAAILAEMAEADSAAGDAALNPPGTLRVTSSVPFAMMHIAPLLPEFSVQYPELSLQILAANRYPDFIEAGIDVAIRTREYEGDSGITVSRADAPDRGDKRDGSGTDTRGAAGDETSTGAASSIATTGTKADGAIAASPLAAAFD